MSAYPPPLFSFSTLKFNSLIYEVTETVTAVASSIVNVLSIITNKIFTYDTGLSRELWTDSNLTPILIGSDTTNIELGGFRAIGGAMTYFDPLVAINLFNDSSSLTIGNNSIFVELGHAQVAGDLLFVGNQLNTTYVGGIQINNQTLVALVDTDPVNLFDTNTASITLGQGVDIGNSITIGNSDCNINIGGFQMSFGNLTYYTPLNPVYLFNDSNVIYFGQNSNELYIGQGQLATDYLYVGNQVNINFIAGFLLNNQSIEALVNADPVYLVATTTGNIIFGTGQGATNNLTIGSATNNNKVGKFTFTGDSITSSAVSSAITMFNNITTGSVSIATAGSSITLGTVGNTNTIGRFSFAGNTINSSGTGSTLAILNNQTHTFGCNMLTGFTGATINFATGLTTGPLNIAVNQTATGNINIGSAVSTILCGPNFRFQGSALTSSAVTSAITLFNNITTGSIQFGTGLTGNMTIGSATNTNKVGLFTFLANALSTTNLATTLSLFASQTGSVNFLTAMTANTIAIGYSSAINIASGLVGSFVDIGGSATTTGGLRLYSAITMAYTALTTPISNQVGYIQVGTGTLNSVSPSTTTLRTLSLGVGVWILSAKAWANSSATYFSLFISNTNNAISTTHASILTGTGSGNNAGNVIKYLTVTSGTTPQYFTADASGTFTLQGVSFEAIRIA